MKKLLIAAAAMSVVAGAQAQSSATVYGTIDVGYGSFSTQNDGAAKLTQSGLQYNAHDTSRWGIKAVEDIGGGVKAGVTIESALNTNPGRANSYSSTGAAAGSSFSMTGVGNSIDVQRIGDRILTVDFTMGNHTINAGYQAQPTRALAVAMQGENSNIVGNLVGNDSFLTGRVTAALYTYNAGNGLTVGGAVMQNTKKQDGVNDSKTSNGYSVQTRYTAGAIDAGLVYTEQTTNTACTATSTTFTSATQVASPVCTLVASTKDQKTKAFLAAGSYDFGVVRAFVEHANVKVEDSVSASPTNDSQRYATSLGLRVPLTAKAWVGGQYSMGKTKQNSATYEGDWTGYSITARYNFSNRTAAYAGVGEAKSDYDATHTTKATQYAFGLLHNF